MAKVHARNRCWFVPPAKAHPLSTTSATSSAWPASTTISRQARNASEVEFKGFRILLQVCYDLRFPVFSRNNGSTPYDLAIYRRQLARNPRCCVAHPPAGPRH